MNRNDVITKEFGKLVKKGRRSKGYTQRELAAIIDSSSATVHFIEHGEQTPSFIIFFRLCHALDLDSYAEALIRNPGV